MRKVVRWTAPFAGVGMGIWLAFRYARQEGQPVSKEMLLIGVTMGGVAGLIALIADLTRSDGDETRGSFGGRVLAVVSVPLAVLPFIGFLVSTIAVFVNRRVSGWPKVTSWIGAAVAIIFTSVALIGITASARSKAAEQHKPKTVHIGRQK